MLAKTLKSPERRPATRRDWLLLALASVCNLLAAWATYTIWLDPTRSIAIVTVPIVLGSFVISLGQTTKRIAYTNAAIALTILAVAGFLWF